MTGMKAEIEKSADDELVKLLANVSTEAVATKLRNLHDVCRHLTMKTEQRLTLANVLRHYADRVSDPKQAISEQTVRNKRANGNPYMQLYRAWERVAEAKVSSVRHDPRPLDDGDLHSISDPAMRHRVLLMIIQNRSLQNQLDMARKLKGAAPIVIPEDGEDPQNAQQNLILTPAEIEAVRDFIDPRKLKAKRLKRSADDAVRTLDDRPVADPGFISALQKIARSYGQVG